MDINVPTWAEEIFQTDDVTRYDELVSEFSDQQIFSRLLFRYNIPRRIYERWMADHRTQKTIQENKEILNACMRCGSYDVHPITIQSHDLTARHIRCGNCSHLATLDVERY